MSAAQHTPGPWVANEQPNAATLRNPRISSDSGEIGMAFWAGSEVQTRSNALLMAGAPVLLAALDALLDDVGRASSLPGAVKARAAITQATGGSWRFRQSDELESPTDEIEALRLYVRALCKAIDACTDFAGTVAGGASWWDDVWPDHTAALDRARAAINKATGGAP